MPMAAFIVDHQKSPSNSNSNSNLKHFCKICKKGFGCGRALGGHMRAHGIGIGIGIADDSAAPMDADDDPASDWDDNKPIPTNRRMYALRTNPNRLKTCRVCHNCGKEFLSWKSFLEHGKCTATDDDLDVDDSLPLSSPTCSDDEYYDYDDECAAATGRRGCGANNWSKRKRSLRVKVGSPNSNEEEDLANCLMMLSNGAVDPTSEEDAEESCASASKEEHHQDRTMTTMTTTTSNIIRKPINFIPPISSYRVAEDQNKGGKGGGAGKGMFECKACKKVFNSHQALGGHRASHKKVKGCFAARLEHHMDMDAQNDDVLEDSLFFPTSKSSSGYHYDNGSGGLASTSKMMRKTKVHECSICHRIFSSGQALGGHKRCHWITSNAPAPSPADAKNNIHHFHDHATTAAAAAAPNSSALVLPLDLKLDLNLPAPVPSPAPAPSFHAVSTDIYLQSWASCKTENECHPNHNQIHNSNNNNNNNNNKNNDQLEDQNKAGNSNGGNSATMVKNKNNGGHILDDEEADSKVKLAKLSDLKDMNMSGGNSSPWLQVGIGSTTDHLVTPDP